MSDSEVLIKVNGVSKKFCRDLKRSLWYGVQDICSDLNPFGKNGSPSPISHLPSSLQNSSGLRPDEFWAVNNVSFELRRGECLGLIGRNGAGKTTLLKMLNGLIKPDSGSIAVRGNVGALIALGAGFNPILTGRENVYVNASILGLTKREIDTQMDGIIEFADIREFIDAPVQSYSSGMRVRLGFAIATAIKPDILLLDEVLAVGDAGFRAKCYSRLAKIQKNAAVILVSHSMDYIAQICDRVLHFKKGSGTMYESVNKGVQAYNEENCADGANFSSGHRICYAPVRTAHLAVDPAKVQHGGTVEVRLRMETERELHKPTIAFVVSNLAEQPVLVWHSSQFDEEIEIPSGSSELRFAVGPLWLSPGPYSCSVFVMEARSVEHIVWFWNQAQFILEAAGRGVGDGTIPFVMPYKGHSVARLS